MRNVAIRTLAVLLAGVPIGCTTRWEAALAPHADRLDVWRRNRLEDTTPYVWPSEGVASLFLCRWPDDTPVTISFPIAATAVEESTFEAALAAWEQAGLGIRFVRTAPHDAAIRVEFIEAAQAGFGSGFGNTVADCRLESWPDPDRPSRRIAARLASASIQVVRRSAERLTPARERALADQTTGVWLHELGHALGFQGHARFGTGIMAFDARHTTPVGRRVREGDAWQDASLGALYALPNGLVLDRVAVDPGATIWVDRMRVRAAVEGLDGPFVRVGDLHGRIFWRDAGGSEYGLVLVRVRRVLRASPALTIVPDARARALLGAGARGGAHDPNDPRPPI